MIFLFKMFKEARLKKGEYCNNTLPTEGNEIKCTYKPVETQAKKVERNCRLQNKYGNIPVNAGEYIVKGIDGQYVALSETDFDTLFEKQHSQPQPTPSIEPQPQPQSQPSPAEPQAQPNPQPQPQPQPEPSIEPQPKPQPEPQPPADSSAKPQ